MFSFIVIVDFLFVCFKFKFCGNMEEGFVKGASDNLPKVDSCMIDEFYVDNLDFLSAELRNVKSARSARDSYGDSAIGYVQLKREGPVCTVKAKITPEHNVHSKYYMVEACINETEQKVVSCQCLSCSASTGGCKHGVAFLFWLHRRSEEPSVTSSTCYWKTPSLSKAGRTIKYMDLAALAERPIPKLKPKSENFLNNVIQKIPTAEGGIFDVFHSVKNANSLIFQMYLKYKNEIDSKYRNAENCIKFMSKIMSEKSCEEAEISSRQQAECSEWFELRFGRITASKIYEASKCKTLEGSLTEVILGASTFEATQAIKRGRTLEPEVLKEIATRKNWKIKTSGLILDKNYPIFGASPDGITDQYVIEVKCPSKAETVRQYVDNDNIKPKYHAQIQLQMFFAKKEKGLFCIASPKFEENRELKMYEVTFDKNICDDLIRAGTYFWKNAIYPALDK